MAPKQEPGKPESGTRESLAFVATADLVRELVVRGLLTEGQANDLGNTSRTDPTWFAGRYSEASRATNA